MSDDKTFSKADLDAAVRDAVAKAEEGLKAKRDELMDELKQVKSELRASKTIEPADLQKLEDENDKLRTDLAAAQKQAKDATAAAEKATKALESESGFTSKLLTENALNTALAEAGVKEPAMLKAVKAMMAGAATVAVEGENRIVKVGDKALADHIKEWAATDEAKHFISAPNNSGGGAQGGGRAGSGKTITQAELNALPAKERSAKLTTEGYTLEPDKAA